MSIMDLVEVLERGIHLDELLYTYPFNIHGVTKLSGVLYTAYYKKGYTARPEMLERLKASLLLVKEEQDKNGIRRNKGE